MNLGPFHKNCGRNPLTFDFGVRFGPERPRQLGPSEGALPPPPPPAKQQNTGAASVFSIRSSVEWRSLGTYILDCC